MCGIAGIIEKSGRVDISSLKKMVYSMHHRGPDQQDIFISPDEKIGLGSSRLKIIDLSERASMPMDLGKKVIIMNGEIYNFISLKKYLQRKGERFFSDSDTEVAGRLFIQENERFLRLLRGMFSIAIYDKERGDVLIARDRMGIKPLYVYEDENRIIFASEVRAILSSGLVEPELDLMATAGFFQFGSVKYPYTMVRGVREFPAGHYRWLLSGEPTEYWRIPLQEQVQHLSEGEVKENLRELIEESVKLRLVSDVPLGCFLSGGLDSTIVSSIAKMHKGELNTFSIRFEEEEFDEGSFARKASQFIGTNHNELVVTSEDVIRNIDNIIGSMDQPTVDGFNTYFVSKFTRENGIVVSLSGLGGDELFGGYPSFGYIPLLLYIKRSPILKAGVLISSKVIRRRKFLKAAEFMHSIGGVEEAYFSIRGLFSTKEMEMLQNLKREIFNPIVYLASHYKGNHSHNLINHIAFLELTSYMRDMLLRDTDSMSMAHSLEVRVPFIDHKVIEFVMKLPYKYRNGKRFLHWTFKDLLPDWMEKRKKKGFIFPFEKWLKSGKIKVLDRIKESGFFNNKMVDDVFESVLKGKLDWRPIWAMFVFSLWVERNGLKWKT